MMMPAIWAYSYGGDSQSPRWREVVNPVRSGRKQPQHPNRVPGSGGLAPSPVFKGERP